MRSKAHRLVKTTALLTAVLLLQSVMAIFAPPSRAQQIESTGDFRLTAQSTGGTITTENYIKLNWDSAGAGGYSYVLKQSDDDGATYESRSTNYGKPIKVLNIHPHDGKFLKDWMTAGGAAAPGQGLITVDEVEYKTFNTNAEKYLKNFGTSYAYDVIMFGSSDNNASSGDLSSTTIDALQKYADTGRGILFGHDVAITNYNKPTAWAYRLGRFAQNLLGMSQHISVPSPVDPPASEAQKLYGNEVQAIRDGFLLQYPWRLSPNVKYSVPISHTTYQHAGATAFGVPHNTIWMEYTDPRSSVAGSLGGSISPIIWSDGSTDNFYLVTYNNSAMIQTGHKLGSSTLDERKILANTLMYLAQFTTDTQADDRSAIDKAAPTILSAERASGNSGRDVAIKGKDNGTKYRFKIEATPLTGAATTKVSDEVSETSITTLKGYYISEDTNPDGVPPIVRDSSGAITSPVTRTASDNALINYTTASMFNYVHIQAVDYAGNLGPVTTLAPVGMHLTLDAETTKMYKPSMPGLSAKIAAAPGMDNLSAEYILVPVSDTTDYGNKSAFDGKTSTIVDPEHKGPMFSAGGGGTEDVWLMYSTIDNTLNGIKNNCTLWVKATGTMYGTEVVSFAKHTFTNIYTQLNQYTTGSGAYTYSKTRVGGLSATYGVQLDQDGSTSIPSALATYESVSIAPDFQSPLYTITPGASSLSLTNITQNNQTHNFTYAKKSGYWLSTTFSFKTSSNTALPGDPPDQIIPDFAPSNGSGVGIPFSSPYSPPAVTGYVPVGFIINPSGSWTSADVVPASFPGGFANVTIPADNTVVLIVYESTATTVSTTEQYHLFDSTGVDLSPPNLQTDNVLSFASGGTFSPLIENIPGHAYTGYDVYIESAPGSGTFDNLIKSDRMSRTNPVAFDFATPSNTPWGVPDWTSRTNVTVDTHVVYHYEEDSTDTGIPDALQVKIHTKGIGIDSHGNQSTLYTGTETCIKGSNYDPTPLGGADGFGNSTVFVDSTGAHWILADGSLNDLTSFIVSDEKSLDYYYYKDTGPTGTPDFFEANITVEFYYKDDAAPGGFRLFSSPAPYVVTEATSVDSFQLVAPHVTDYAPMYVTFIKDTEPGNIIKLTPRPITGRIPILNKDNWTMRFYYDTDSSHTGIPDAMDAKLEITCVYFYADGFEERAQPRMITGFDGEAISVDPDSYNTSTAFFRYDGTPGAQTYTLDHDNTTQVTLTYHEITPPPPPPPTPNPPPAPGPSPGTPKPPTGGSGSGSSGTQKNPNSGGSSGEEGVADSGEMISEQTDEDGLEQNDREKDRSPEQLARDNTLSALSGKGTPSLKIGGLLIPLYGYGMSDVWSLFNLLAAVAACACFVNILLRAYARQKNETLSVSQRLKIIIGLVIGLGAVNVVLFIVISSLQGVMVVFDAWSFVMAALLGLQIFLMLRGQRQLKQPHSPTPPSAG